MWVAVPTAPGVTMSAETALRCRIISEAVATLPVKPDLSRGALRRVQRLLSALKDDKQ
jgi:hypothetical protein